MESHRRLAGCSAVLRMAAQKKEKTNTDHLFKMSLHILISPIVKKRNNLERNTVEIKCSLVISRIIHQNLVLYQIKG